MPVFVWLAGGGRGHAAPRQKLGLCDIGQSGYDPTHFETFSTLKQYSTNAFMNGKGAGMAKSVDFKRKSSEHVRNVWLIQI
jgi:hypothetical protein